MLASLRAVVRKEIRQTLRDRRVMFLLLGAPIIQLVIFGNAVDLDVDRVPAAVVDHDRSAASRAFLRGLLADGTLVGAAEYVDDGGAERDLVTGRARAAVIVENGFAQALARGIPSEPARIQVIVDGTNPNVSGVAASAAARYALDSARSALLDRVARAGDAAPRVPMPTALETRVLYNPRLETAVYMVPGIAAMLLLLITTIVTAMGLARERESGTLEQVLVTPIRPAVLIVGKMLPFAVVGLFDFALAMAVGAYVFDMPIRGSVVLLLVATTLYLGCTLAAGLLVSTVSRTQQQAFMGGFLFMMPAALLSGIMTPVHAMPELLQAFTLVNPLRHYAEIMRAVLLRDAGWSAVSTQLFALFGIALALASIAISRFRKTLA